MKRANAANRRTMERMQRPDKWDFYGCYATRHFAEGKAEALRRLGLETKLKDDGPCVSVYKRRRQ